MKLKKAGRSSFAYLFISNLALFEFIECYYSADLYTNE